MELTGRNENPCAPGGSFLRSWPGARPIWLDSRGVRAIPVFVSRHGSVRLGLVRSYPMNYRRLFLALGLVAVLAVPAPAGIIFGKHPKPSPAERVPQLLAMLQAEADEGKRANAAKELRDFD